MKVDSDSFKMNFDMDSFKQYLKSAKEKGRNWAIYDPSWFYNKCRLIEHTLIRQLDFKWRYWRSIEKNTKRALQNIYGLEISIYAPFEILHYMLTEDYEFEWHDHIAKFPHHRLRIERSYDKKKFRVVSINLDLIRLRKRSNPCYRICEDY